MRKIFFQNKCLTSWFFLLVLLSAGCKRHERPSPENYDLNRPLRTTLGKALNEISGICFAQKATLLAVADSKDKIFEIHLASRKLKDHTGKIVDKGSDLEDIVQVDSTIYVLESRGVIKEIGEHSTDTTGIRSYALPVDGKNDFETLYYDESAGGLIALCKNCANEKGNGVRTAYRFDLSTKTFDSAPYFTIDKGEVRKLLKNADAKFDPSAAAIHPVSRRLYILSSAGHLLVITDNKGSVIEAYELNPDEFQQPEGIAFDKNGDMYITNEGKSGPPTLLYFPYHPNGKQKEK